MISRILSSGTFRATVGFGTSAVLLVATASAVDPQLLARAWGRIGFGLIVVAAVLSILEVNVRAVRWRLLLLRLVPVSHRDALAYLCLGHLANAILPARLGDVARVLVTGTRLRTPRSSVLGTIAVERISDTALLGIAVSVAVLIGFRQFAPAVAAILAAGAMAAAVAVVALVLLRRNGIGTTRAGGFLRIQGSRFWEGAAGLRTARQMTAWVVLTIGSFSLTVVIFSLITWAVGLSMPIWQAALVIAAVTLSTGIPAGPASIGTYEFVGMTVMVSMGFGAEPSLLSVALVHAVAVIPASLVGLGAMWWFGIRPHVPRVSVQSPATDRVS